MRKEQLLLNPIFCLPRVALIEKRNPACEPYHTREVGLSAASAFVAWAYYILDTRTRPRDDDVYYP